MRLDVHHSGTITHAVDPITVNVEHHFPEDPAVTPGQADQILTLLTQLGATMTVLSDAVADVRQRVTVKDEQQDALIADLTAQLAAANSSLVDALANDAADQATIDAKQAEIDAANASNADKQAQIDAANQDVQDAVAVLDTIDAAPAEPPADGGDAGGA